jgi:MFS transporter, DHA3 family, macrolide efflux protein
MNDQQVQQNNWKLPFFTIWGGGAISLFGSSLAQFALVWWLTATTGSATVLATASLVALLPGVLLGPFAGAIVDRWDRRIIMILSDGASALAAALLVFLFWIDAVAIWHIYVIMLIRSLTGTFHFPAMQASVSLMVPEQQLTRIAGLNQLLHGSMSIAAPPLGALLLAIMPVYAVLGIDVVTAALAIGTLFVVRIPRPRRTAERVSSGAVSSLLGDMKAGLLYVWQWPGLVGVLGMATLINFLLNPAFSLMPLLVTGHFGGDALRLGWMNSAGGVGMLMGGLLLGAWGGFRRRMATSLSGLLGMSLGILVLGLAPANGFWLAFGAMIWTSIMMSLANGPMFALLQAVVAPEMQGRVFTLTGSLSGGMAPLGLLIAGPMADRFGVQVWYLIGGFACLMMGMIGFLVPTIFHIEDQVKSTPEHADEPALTFSHPLAKAVE